MAAIAGDSRRASHLALALVWLADPRVGRLWLNTAWLAAGACLVALPIGTLLAVISSRRMLPGRGSPLCCSSACCSFRCTW